MSNSRHHPYWYSRISLTYRKLSYWSRPKHMLPWRKLHLDLDVGKIICSYSKLPKLLIEGWNDSWHIRTLWEQSRNYSQLWFCPSFKAKYFQKYYPPKMWCILFSIKIQSKIEQTIRGVVVTPVILAFWEVEVGGSQWAKAWEPIWKTKGLGVWKVGWGWLMW